jgi:23S rRNA (adenine2503-C2)-methyltransferase
LDRYGSVAVMSTSTLAPAPQAAPEPTAVRVQERPRRTLATPRHWAELDAAEKTAAVAQAGLPAFRLRQIDAHYYRRFEGEPDQWTDLSPADRETVATLFPPLITPVTQRTADRGTTVKSLYRLSDGVLVETVLMRYGLRRDLTPGPRGVRSTLCVSSQAGCGMACPFCATGQGGLDRNLTAGEIIEQVRSAAGDLARGELPGGPGHLSNIVFMGMGEPLANYRALLQAVRAITTPQPEGFGISARSLTISTVGLVPRIATLATEGLPITLAVSLHAPDDDLRDELCPINRRWNVSELLNAAHAYYETTGRRVSIEYALIRDINDQAFRAGLLADRLLERGKGWAHVNLIPLNPTPGSKWTASRPGVQEEFVARLERRGLPVTVRDTRGSDIDGACGQLAARVRDGVTAANANNGPNAQIDQRGQVEHEEAVV